MTPSGRRYSWTQPLCSGCWDGLQPGRTPAVLTEPEPETCCVCGQRTNSGIYMRIDPNACAHPTLTKD